MGGTGMDQRRPLALLFTDITNSTALAATMEPEDYADILTDMRAALQQVADRYDGQIIRVDGDGALCMFGYSRGTDHAGKMAALAALDFHAALADYANRRNLDALAVHSGIHAGVVLLRQGDLVRGRFEVIGDATNIAARLCDAAGAGEILISHDALGSHQSHFDLAARRTIRLSSGGREGDRTIAAYPVRGVQAHRQASAQPSLWSQSAIFGRETELALAHAWLSSDPIAAPVFFVQAEAGGGKSRLLRAIAAKGAADGLRIVHGQCEDNYLSAPLQPMVEIARALASPMGLGDEPWERQDRIRDIIVDAARQSPVLMVIDDWQWADDATKRMVEQCLQFARGTIRLLVASRCDDPGLKGHNPQWTTGLPPMESAAIGAMVGALAPHFDPQRVRKIRDLSGGNPLLIEELCREPDFAPAGATDERVSFRVAVLVERRVAAMPIELSRWLDVISICLGPVPVTALAELVGLSHADADDMVPRLASIDLLHIDNHGSPEGVTVQFRHALLKQALLNRLSPQRRRTLHAAVARHMIANGPSRHELGRKEQLAYHLLASNNAQGLDYALSAGKSAMQAGSLDRAVGQYRRAIDFAHRNRHTRDEETMLRLANRFGSAVLLDAHVEHFVPLEQLQAIAEQQGLSSIKGRLLYWKASLHYATGRPDEAKAVLAMPDFAQMFAEAGLPLELVTALHGQLGVLMAKHRDAARQMDAAIVGFKDFPNPAYDNSLAYMLLMRAQLRGEQGYFADAARDFDHAERLMQGKDQPLYASALTQKAGVALWAEDYAKAREYAAAGLLHGDRAGSRYYAMLSRALDAAAQGYVNPREDALEEMEHCLRWSAHAQSGYTLSLIHSWAADLALRLGDDGRAAHHALLCIGQGRHRLYWGAAQAWRVRAALALDFAAANRALRHAYAHARRMASPREWAANLLSHAALSDRFGKPEKGRALRAAGDAMRQAIGLPAARLHLASDRETSEVPAARTSAL